MTHYAETDMKALCGATTGSVTHSQSTESYISGYGEDGSPKTNLRNTSEPGRLVDCPDCRSKYKSLKELIN